MSDSKSADLARAASTEDAVVPSEGAPQFEPYESPAGGWGALQATAKALREQSVVLKGSKALLSMNQPDGFDCPGCAWPDPKHTSSFEFCENGAKAVAFELTSRRVTQDFFATHAVRELEEHSDYWLEEQGRLTEPMRYDADTDHYVPIAWEDAFTLIGRELHALQSPDQAEFYTSGRTSNEAAFLYLGLDDRYRGVFGGRMVVFMNETDMRERNIAPGALVEIEALAGDGQRRVVRGFKVKPYAIPRGSIGAYYPEANTLLPLSFHDAKSKTPAAKSIPVLVRAQ